MATYNFFTITPAQAAAFDPANDTIFFASNSANEVDVVLGTSTTTLTLAGVSVVLGTTTSTVADYVFSDNFYSEKTTAMTVDELLIYEAITRKTSGPLTSLIVEHLDPVFKLPLEKQFYKIPLCIHLIDMALRSQYREIDAPSMNYASSGDD